VVPQGEIRSHDCTPAIEQTRLQTECTDRNGCVLSIDLTDNQPNPCRNTLNLAYSEVNIEESPVGALFSSNQFIRLTDGPLLAEGSVYILAHYPEVQGDAQFLWAFGNPIENSGANKAGGYFDNRRGVLMGFAMWNDPTGCRGSGIGGHGGMGAYSTQGSFSLDTNDYFLARYEWIAVTNEPTRIHHIMSDLSPSLDNDYYNIVQAELAEREIPYDPSSAALGCDGYVKLDGVSLEYMLFGTAPNDGLGYNYGFNGRILKIFVFNQKHNFTL